MEEIRRSPVEVGSLSAGFDPSTIGNPYNGVCKPYCWVDEYIPCYMESLDRVNLLRFFFKCKSVRS